MLFAGLNDKFVLKIIVTFLVKISSNLKIRFMKIILPGLTLYSFISLSSFAQSPGSCGKNNLPAPNNGNGSLGFTYDTSGCGLNYVQSSRLVSKKFDQYTTASNYGSGLPVTINISGIPMSASIEKAYAWYIVSYLNATPPSTTLTITNPNNVTSSATPAMIGQDQNKCWGETGTAVYRADITSEISGNGNYVVNIGGLSGTLANFLTPADQVDGITLFVIYKDLTANYQGSFVIWDGNMTGVGNSYTQTMTNINACANSTYANAFNIISDMQDNINGNQHPSTLNGITQTFPNNMYNFDIANTNVTAGQSTSTFGTDGLGSDCFTWAVMGLYYQTANCIVCSGCTTTVAAIDSIIPVSSCTVNDGAIYMSDSSSAPPVTYLWSNGSTTQDITGLSPGTYSVIITDTVCSFTVYVNVPSPSSLNVSIGSITTVACGGNTGAIDVIVSGGIPPYIYSWSNGATTQDVSGLAYGTFSLTVTDSAGCTDAISASVMGPPNVAFGQICMVTVDSLSKYNMIIWDKTLFPKADSFIIYREITTNTYLPIGSISYDSLSIFIDTVRTKYFPNTGDPNAGTYRYKMQIKDSCGNMSTALSPYHNTIFITNNNGNFSWPQLYTIENNTNPVNAYVLMRDDYSNGNWNAINSVAGTQQTVSDPAYSAWQATASYRIQTLWNITCTPSRITPELTATYNSSKSNIAGILSSVNEISIAGLISVYPNPASENFTLTSNKIQLERLKILNVLGEIIYESNIASKTSSFNIVGYPAGIYFLHLKCPQGTAVKKLVIK